MTGWRRGRARLLPKLSADRGRALPSVRTIPSCRRNRVRETGDAGRIARMVAELEERQKHAERPQCAGLGEVRTHQRLGAANEMRCRHEASPESAAPSPTRRLLSAESSGKRSWARSASAVAARATREPGG